MPLDLGNPVWLTIVADANTPADVAGYAGIRIPVPEGTQLPDAGRQDTLSISGVTVHGYIRDGQQGLEWLLTPVVNPNAAALEIIPGPQGWTSQASKSVYANLGAALLGLGVPGANVRTGFKQLYNAAVANYVAEQESA